VQDLLSVSDPDWAKFTSDDPEYLLRVAGDAIRTYCGWHIFPNIQQTVTNIPVQSRGMIMLPSLLVTAVESVTLQSVNGETDNVLDPDSYNWFPNGTIEPLGWQWYGAYSGFYYGPDNWSYLPVFQFGLATVVFNSGYEIVPSDIKQLAFEMAQASGAVGGDSIPNNSNVKEVASPGFRLLLGGSGNSGTSGTGTVGSFTSDQKNRLAPYRLQGVK
jgi:hypothetical protein